MEHILSPHLSKNHGSSLRNAFGVETEKANECKNGSYLNKISDFKIRHLPSLSFVQDKYLNIDLLNKYGP